MKLYNLQKYAFTKNFFEEMKDTRVGYENDRKKQNVDKKIKADVVHVQQQVQVKQQVQHSQNNKIQSLFWAFFCIYRGEEEYHLNKSNSFKMKNEFSLKFVEDLKKEKVFMKQNKIRFHDVEASMLFDKDINLDSLRALCLFYKVKLYFVINNRYYFFEPECADENSNDTYMIHQNRHSISYEKFDTNILKGKLYMEGTKITLKAPGSYKLDELKEICNTLGIDMKNADGKKKTKQQLYDDIIIKID
jgi:hypothetical protein